MPQGTRLGREGAGPPRWQHPQLPSCRGEVMPGSDAQSEAVPLEAWSLQPPRQQPETPRSRSSEVQRGSEELGSPQGLGSCSESGMGALLLGTRPPPPPGLWLRKPPPALRVPSPRFPFPPSGAKQERLCGH